MTPLEEALEHYSQLWLVGGYDVHQQSTMRQRMLDLLHSSRDAFQRFHPPGHFTGSALVVDPDLTRVALTLHKKLGKWLQFGGHADGHQRLDEVALREAQEESGLVQLEFLHYEGLFGSDLCHVPLDLDIHEIPPYKEVPAHFHYDVIYLLRSLQPELLEASDESEAVAWFTWERARELCPEPNLQRCFAKLEWMRSSLKAPAPHAPPR